MENIRANHHLGREIVEHQQQHDDDAARPYGGHAHQESREQANHGHPSQGFHARRPLGHVFFDLVLEEQENRNADQQDSDGSSDKGVDAVAVDRLEMAQQADSHDGTGNAAEGEAEDNPASHRAALQMYRAGPDSGNEIKERVRADGYNRRYAQKKDQHRQEQYAAAHAGHADQRAHHKAD